MKKILFKFFIFIILIFNLNLCLASSQNIDFIDETINSLELEKYDTIINKNVLNSDKFSFSETIKQFILGESEDFSIKNLLNILLKNIFNEVLQNSQLMKNVIIIAIFCALLKILTDSFKNQGVGEISFYTGYIIIITLVISSFNTSIFILEDTIFKICTTLQAISPLLAGTLVISGQAATAATFSTLLVSFISITSFLVKKFFIPYIVCATILNIVNYLVPRQILNNLVDFLKWLITFSMKSITTIFITIISFQRIATPMVNMSVHKTARTLVGFIPIVGSAMGNAMDGVIHFINVLKGGIGLAIFIVIVLCCLLPILKLISIIVIYKITAVIIEPISDKRLTSCISSIAEFTKLVLSTLVLFIFLFIFFVLTVLTIST